MELDLGKGRNEDEVVALGKGCPECRHGLRRHLHAAVRRTGMAISEEKFPLGPPPRESRLGQLLAEYGDYDDYHRRLRRDLAEPPE